MSAVAVGPGAQEAAPSRGRRLTQSSHALLRPMTRVARPPAALRPSSRRTVPTRALLDAESAWQLKGACRRADPELFFHPDRERGEDRRVRVAAAKRICAQCPVVQACREHALLSPERQGVWGGLSESELADLRSSRTA